MDGFQDIIRINNRVEDKAGEVFKELQEPKNIDMKTDLSHNEINSLTKIKFLQNLSGSKLLDNMLSSFMRLRLSLDRKSRNEILEIKKRLEESQQKERELNNQQPPGLSP